MIRMIGEGQSGIQGIEGGFLGLFEVVHQAQKRRGVIIVIIAD